MRAWRGSWVRAISCVAITAVIGPSLRSGRLEGQGRQGAPGRAGQDPSLVTVERIYSSRDFAGESFGPARWLDDSTYTAVEPAANGKGADLVRIDAATGRKSVLVSAALLTPAGKPEPLEPEEYE